MYYWPVYRYLSCLLPHISVAIGPNNPVSVRVYLKQHYVTFKVTLEKDSSPRSQTLPRVNGWGKAQ